MADSDGHAEISTEQADQTMTSRPYIGLLVVVAVIGVVVSLAAWCFLDGGPNRSCSPTFPARWAISRGLRSGGTR
jgi:hypothetical protein